MKVDFTGGCFACSFVVDVGYILATFVQLSSGHSTVVLHQIRGDRVKMEVTEISGGGVGFSAEHMVQTGAVRW